MKTQANYGGDSMTNYKLNDDETIIMQTDGATLIDNDDDRNLDEVVLTNQNVILVTRVADGLFKKKTLLMRCPLNEIIIEDNSPKVRADVFNGYQCLRIFYPETTLVINFDQNSSRLTKRWADGIKKAVLGDFASIQTSDNLGSQLNDLMVDLKKAATPALGYAADFLSSATEMVSDKVQSYSQNEQDNQRVQEQLWFVFAEASCGYGEVGSHEKLRFS